MGKLESKNDHLTESLLYWYDSNKRALPWRTHRSLYRTIVSEFMAQQTQVKTMLPYFSNWMRKYPDIATLSEASEEEVVRDWEGLGYYRRARNLRKVAIKWMESPEKPTSYKAWLDYPGVGPYMAAAIASIDFNEPIVAVDGNVIRVISRLNGVTDSFKGSAQITKAIRPLAQQIISLDRPGDFNQALMELGATVCKPKNPECKKCPFKDDCKALEANAIDQIPSIEKKKTIKIERPRLLVMDGKRKHMLLAQGQLENRLHGMYELPLLSMNAETTELEKVGTIKRGISNELITEPIFKVEKNKHKKYVYKKTEPVWIPLESLREVSLSGPHRKWISDFLFSNEDSC